MKPTSEWLGGLARILEERGIDVEGIYLTRLNVGDETRDVVRVVTSMGKLEFYRRLVEIERSSEDDLTRGLRVEPTAAEDPSWLAITALIARSERRPVELWYPSGAEAGMEYVLVPQWSPRTVAA